MSSDREALEAGETGCSLYLLGPLRPAPEGFAGQLDAALACGGSAAFLLRSGDETRHLSAAALQPVCRRHEVAFLIEDDLALALQCRADGLHLSSPEGLAEARARLGPDAILGVSCGVSRHRAMVAGEGGADYVAFGDPNRLVNTALLEIVAWWSGLFVLPCLALGVIDARSCPELVRAGADFLGVDAAVWNHPEGPVAGVRALQAAMA